MKLKLVNFNPFDETIEGFIVTDDNHKPLILVEALKGDERLVLIRGDDAILEVDCCEVAGDLILELHV